MRTTLAGLGLVLALFLSFGARADGVDAGDRQAIRSVIAAQLDAFRSGDSARAFSYAAPRIKAKFGTSENFMAMVRAGYPMIFASRKATFMDTIAHSGGVFQKVLVIGDGGGAATAIYEMQRQPDGVWLINGCALVRGAEAGA